VTAKEQTRGTSGLLEYAQIQLMCHENETRLIFDFNDYMGSGLLTIAYRVDGGVVQEARASVSEGGQVVGFWKGTGIPLAKQLQRAHEIVVSAKPYNEPTVEAIFPITGMEEVVADVRKHCGW
jgi:Type VI secretion system VasI, EvfG, VC_A0118